MYFAGEALNDADIVLKRVPVAERSKVVIVGRRPADGEPPVFAFNIAIAPA